MATKTMLIACILTVGLVLAPVVQAAKVTEVKDNKGHFADPPTSGTKYTVKFETDAGEPNIKDLHIRKDCDVSVSDSGDNEKTDIEIKPPSGWTVEASHVPESGSNSFAGTCEASMTAPVGNAGLAQGSFEITVNERPGLKSKTMELVFTKDGKVPFDDPAIAPNVNDNTIPNSGQKRVPTLLASVGGFVDGAAPTVSVGLPSWVSFIAFALGFLAVGQWMKGAKKSV